MSDAPNDEQPTNDVPTDGQPTVAEHLRRVQKNHTAYSKFTDVKHGLLYLMAAAAIQFASWGPLSDGGPLRGLVDSVSDRPIAAVPLSKALNLEERMAENADNVVRISSAYGIGTGILVDPYTVITANHVVEDAAVNNAPIFVQSQSYLAEGESIRVDLKPGNFRHNKDSDLAEIMLAHPIYGAATLRVDRGSSNPFDGNDRCYAVCYRDKEVVTLRGHVNLIVGGGDAGRYYLTDMQGGPGNSGCGVFNGNHYLAGIIVAVPRDKPYTTNLDTGNLIISDIGNPL